jgi:uncharacterized protein GlcG (DUF336 family)
MMARRLSRSAFGVIAMAAALICASCGGGGGGSSLVTPTFAPETPLSAAEVDGIIERAAGSVDAPNMTIAVVDRFGRVLGLWSRNPATSENDLNIAVSIARTAAFMSSSQGPITTRTLEFISTFHFPATFGGLTRNPIPNNPFTLDATLASQRTTTGVAGTPQGPLWQIFSSNRGAPVANVDVAADGIVLPAAQQTAYNPGMEVPPPRRIDTTGAPLLATPGQGLTYLAGGIPLYKDGQGPAGAFTFDFRQVGAVGTYITDPGSGVAQPQAMEFASLTGAGLGAAAPFAEQLDDPVANPAPTADAQRNFFFPVPPQGAIFLVGVLLPEHEQTSRPAGFGPALAGTTPGGGGGATIISSQPGGPLPFGYMVGPRADPLGNLTAMQVDAIIQAGVATANGTRAAIRLLPPFVGSQAALGAPTKMWISITNLDGVPLAVFRMEDAPIFSFDVSLTKARNVTYFSSVPGGNPDMSLADQALLNAAGIPTGQPGPGLNGVAITTRTLAFLTQPFHPPGIDTSGTFPGPLYPLAAQNAQPSQYNRQASEAPSPGLQSGIIFFPGAAPLYVNGQLVGGIGVSGDGVEQDDFVTAGAVGGFEPPTAIRVDNFSFQGVRHPYFKFPQLPGPGAN